MAKGLRNATQLQFQFPPISYFWQSGHTAFKLSELQQRSSLLLNGEDTTNHVREKTYAQREAGYNSVMLIHALYQLRNF